jgi:hypothetical protein
LPHWFLVEPALGRDVAVGFFPFLVGERLVFLAGHFDVTADGEQADAVVGFAVAEAEEPRGHAEAETIDIDAAELGGDEVTELVHEDEHPEHGEEDENIEGTETHDSGNRLCLLYECLGRAPGFGIGLENRLD